MSVSQFLTLVGLALGAIWAFEGFGAAALAAFLAAVFYVVGLVLEGRLDLGQFSSSGPSDRNRF